MEQEQRKQINLNFSEKYIMGKEERISKNRKKYEVFWIMIPDGNEIDIASKRVFSIQTWLVGNDKEFDDRRFIRLDAGRLIPVYVARGLNESFDVDKDLYHLVAGEEIKELFKKHDRKPYSSGNPAESFGSEQGKEEQTSWMETH